MANLNTTYLGLQLRNPIVIGASPLTSSPEKIKKLEQAGAGAVVYKTLYEEQIELETLELENSLNEYADRNAEMTTLFPTVKHAGPRGYLLNLKKTKNLIGIPLIASLNAVVDDTWVEYAKLIEEAGADALELNFYATPTSTDVDESTIVSGQIETLRKVRKVVSIPVSVKLSPFYANPLNVIKRMDDEKIQGFVLFNRLYQPDIDIEKEEMKQSIMLSRSHDIKLAIRFAGLLHGNIKSGIASSGGILNADDAIKTLLAGSQVFQITSALFHNSIDYISVIASSIEKWMKVKGYNEISDFRGKLSKTNVKTPFAYHRAQYVDLMMSAESAINRPTLP